jgi:UMF1 family MFS transporter
VRICFFLVAIWWAVFSIPVFVFVNEPKSGRGNKANPILTGVRQLYATFLEIRKLRVAFLFLLGYWLYIDGVHTIIRMAIDYGMSLGFSRNSLIVALLITQFVGFPAALAFGKIGEKLGAKTGILIGIGAYLGITLWGAAMHREFEFYVLAVAVGLVQGGVQSLSRSFYAKIIPSTKSAEFFGFYNMLGKFAAVIGPFLMGWVSLISGNPRYAILSISLLFVCGAAILFMVNEKEGHRMASNLEQLS